MKKLFTLLLAVLMTVSMVACGDKTTQDNSSSDTQEHTLDDLLADAVELDGNTFFQEYQSNKVKLSSQYEGKSCLVAGTIDAIENDHIVVVDSNLKVNVYIPTDEIIELEKNQYVEVVGILENIGSEQELSMIWATVDFNTGYLSKSVYSKTGIYKADSSTDGTHPQGTYLECINDSGNKYFVEVVLTDEQRESLTRGSEVTLVGKLFVNDNKMPHSAYTKLIVETIE